MDKDQTKALIDKAGGDTAFARYLGIDKKRGYQQRVNNWKRRGIPSEVMLKYQRKINSLARKLVNPLILKTGESHDPQTENQARHPEHRCQAG